MSHSGSGNTQYNIAVRVPPGVRSSQLAFYVSGWGFVSVDSGLFAGVSDLNVTETADFQAGQWIYSGYDEGTGATQPLRLRVEADDAWNNVDVTFTLIGDMSIYAIAWLMLHSEGAPGQSVWPGTAGGFSTGFDTGFNTT